jgi:hypothetical protein
MFTYSVRCALLCTYNDRADTSLYDFGHYSRCADNLRPCDNTHNTQQL